MRQDLFDAILKRGGLFLFWDPKPGLTSQWLFDLNRELQAGQSLLVVDLDQRLSHLYTQTLSALNIFSVRQVHKNLQLTSGICKLDQGLSVIGVHQVPAQLDASAIQGLQYNLHLLRESYTLVLVVIPRAWPEWASYLTKSSAAVLIRQESKSQLPDQSLPWISIDLPAETLSHQMMESLRLRILKKNPPSTWKRYLVRFWWILSLILLALVLSIPLRLDSPNSLYRSLEGERRLFMGKPFIQYQFDGQTTVQRLAKHTIGRYTALVPAESEIKEYLQEVWLRNPSTDTTKWKRESNGTLIPASGVELRFYPPERLFGIHTDSLLPAWRYYTALLSDSLAYLTEYYNPTGKSGRKHLGIDVAGRHGTRILAPFEGKAWTFEDERGGVVMAISQESFIILYMHCDQLLYMDGQAVFAGDPVATVGMTGHTTGPHVHIATGIIRKQGAYSAGPVRYDMIDPVHWFYQRSLKMREAGPK